MIDMCCFSLRDIYCVYRVLSGDTEDVTVGPELASMTDPGSAGHGWECEFPWAWSDVGLSSDSAVDVCVVWCAHESTSTMWLGDARLRTEAAPEVSLCRGC